MAASLAGGAGVEEAELAIRAGLAQLGCGLLEPLLAVDPGYRGPRANCGQGHQAEFAGYRDKAIDTVLGPVTIRRAWYHCGSCGHGFAPRDAELGVAGQTMSPGLAKMTSRAAAAVPFAAAAKLVGELAGITLTGKRAGRRAETDGQAAARVIGAQAAAIAARQIVPLPPAAPLPDMLYIAIDGTGVPMIPAETEGRPGKAEDGKAHTREVKLCCCFTQTSLDEEGHPVRDPRSSSYLATFAPAAGFGILMAGEGRRRGASHVRQVVILGDGAAWIWNLAAAHFPEATQIVDLFHAREHLHDLARLLEFMLGDHKPDWLATRLAELDAGDIPAICAAARAFPLSGRKAADLKTALGYFEHNACRMHYARFKSLGMFVGSGAVEAGCKADRRAAPETVGHEMDPGRGNRHPDLALPASQQPLGRNPDPAQPNTGGLSRSGCAGTTRPPRPGQVTGQSPTFLSHTPGPACRARNDGACRYRRPMRQVIGFEFDLATLRRAIGGGSYVRGTEYARQGAVLHAAWDSEDSALRGMVRGQGSNVYQAAAFFSLVGELPAKFEMGECNCPVEFNCKHVIALVLSALSPASSGTARPTRPAAGCLGAVAGIAAGPGRIRAPWHDATGHRTRAGRRHVPGPLGPAGRQIRLRLG